MFVYIDLKGTPIGPSYKQSAEHCQSQYANRYNLANYRLCICV